MVQIDDQEMEKIVQLLKALADKRRFRLLAMLSEREYTVKELAAELGITEPTVSWHIMMLRSLNMVAMRQEGTAHYYRLQQAGIHELLKDLKTRVMPSEADEDSSEFERHVLNHFFQREGEREIVTPTETFRVHMNRLKEIPTQRKKQLVVLRRLVKEFEPGQRYTEKEVNEILKRFHPDCATLRRLLVDNGLMARERSIYWRTD
ncbi:MAG TPA: metalloregulator ArsR/SmtB family transcription factor [Chthonomonadaceae bacterium]|nr:metalloregulator ArsR/SmtB family transcription factor [Chthonomonadaceae bacterium]